jgi:acyl carrier protein
VTARRHCAQIKVFVIAENSLTESDVRESVVAIIAAQLNIPPDEILGDTSIKEDLGADSLVVISFTTTIENHYRVHLQEEAVREPYTVNSIVRKLMERSDRISAR